MRGNNRLQEWRVWVKWNNLGDVFLCSARESARSVTRDA